MPPNTPYNLPKRPPVIPRITLPPSLLRSSPRVDDPEDGRWDYLKMVPIDVGGKRLHYYAGAPRGQSSKGSSFYTVTYIDGINSEKNVFVRGVVLPEPRYGYPPTTTPREGEIKYDKILVIATFEKQPGATQSVFKDAVLKKAVVSRYLDMRIIKKYGMDGAARDLYKKIQNKHFFDLKAGEIDYIQGFFGWPRSRKRIQALPNYIVDESAFKMYSIEGLDSSVIDLTLGL